MRSVEVTRGASSSLYDNYALGGMVHFRTSRGSDINGFETFLSGGSYGFHKEAFAFGQSTDRSTYRCSRATWEKMGSSGTATTRLRPSISICGLRSMTNRISISRRSELAGYEVPTRLTQAHFSRRAAGRRRPDDLYTWDLQCQLRQCATAYSAAHRSTDVSSGDVRTANQCQYRLHARSRLRRQGHQPLLFADHRQRQPELQDVRRFAARWPPGRDAAKSYVGLLR